MSTVRRERVRTRTREQRAEMILRGVETLPTLPSVAVKLLELGGAEDADFQEVVRLIETDPALAAKVLSLCRRAGLGLGDSVTTVGRAVVMLGMRAVRAAALSVYVVEWGRGIERRRADGRRRGAPAEPDGPSGAPEQSGIFDRAGLWRHSVGVACCAELIGEALRAGRHGDAERGPEFGEGFVAGLVHDLGKLALEMILPRAYARALALSEEHGRRIAACEHRVIGIDHLAAGVRLAEHWGLPEALRGVMGGGDGKLGGIVRLADALCRALHVGWAGDFGPGEDVDALCRAIGLEPERAWGLTERVHEAVASRCGELGLEAEPGPRLLLASMMSANGRLGRLMERLEDTNRRLAQAQQALAEAEAMARLGELTAGAAHEMNNPLAVISGRAQTLIGRFAKDTDRAAVAAILEAAKRLAGLIERLHLIASPPEPEPGMANPLDAVQQAVRAARERVGREAEGGGGGRGGGGGKALHVPVRVVARDVRATRLDSGMLRAALVEIIANALESGPKGEVEVRVGYEEKQGTEELVIRTSDTGCGMSEHGLKHAFDPFFSEKPAGRRAGLGLPTAKRLVELQGGRIGIESRAGVGTVVEVRLPVREG